MTVKIFDFSGIWRAVFKIRFRKENMLHPQEAVNKKQSTKIYTCDLHCYEYLPFHACNQKMK